MKAKEETNVKMDTDKNATVNDFIMVDGRPLWLDFQCLIDEVWKSRFQEQQHRHLCL